MNAPLARLALRRAAVSAAAIAAILLAGPSHSLAIPPEGSDPSADVYSGPIPMHHAPDHWVESPFTWQYGDDAITGQRTKMVGAWVAFRPSAAGGVRPGDAFLARVSASISGTGGGGSLVGMGLRLPPNTSFAVDRINRITCLLYPGGSNDAIDVTADPSAGCPATPAPTAGGGNLGNRVIANRSQFVINVPLRATAPVGGGRLVGEVESDQAVAPQGPALPEVTLTEPPAVVAPSLGPLLVCVWDNPRNPGPC